MFLDHFFDAFGQHGDKECLVWRGESYSYAWLMDRCGHYQAWLQARGARTGDVIALEADFSPESIALMLALIETGAIVIPFSSGMGPKAEALHSIAQTEVITRFCGKEPCWERRSAATSAPALYQELRRRGHPGLVLFSSGSSGRPKGIVHDLVPLLQKFYAPRPAYRSIAFLLFDHVGGFNTMLHMLANGGCLVLVEKRDPDTVLAAIEEHRVELLPTSPTFLNLMLLAEAHARHDVSCLKMITYGTEPMPEATLQKCRALLPGVTLQQTYGLTELGILRSKSKSSDSLWVKIGGDGVKTRVADGMLQIQSPSAMLGYLNAPSPFTPDGWFLTGDCVEQDGEFFKILGRASDIINVGGEKVYPAEVEGVLQNFPNVESITVFGEKNAIVGNIVCAKVKLLQQEDTKEFLARFKAYCAQHLKRYQIPARVQLSREPLHSERLKKMRAATS